MEYARIVGGGKLKGEVWLQGSKNAVLPMIAASVLCKGEVRITNCPDISDVRELLEVLQQAGVTGEFADGVLTLDTTTAKLFSVKREFAKKTRGGVLLLGAFLGRFGEAELAYPGGCVIGKRPIDLHCSMLRTLSVELTEGEDGVVAKGRPKGAKVQFPYPSVGATENAILAAVCGEGRTELYGAATEPEIAELCVFLNKAGARIYGIGTDHPVIDGKSELHGVNHCLSGDRIVAGTYLTGAQMTSGELILHGTEGLRMEGILPVLRSTGAVVTQERDRICLYGTERIAAIPYLETAPYPGFPTDMQSQITALLAIAKGESNISETIFESRFGIVPELVKMGADIVLDGQSVRIRGRKRLHGETVAATDLRSGAALVLAALAAEGETRICGCEYIKRGYEDICGVLQGLGADAMWVEEQKEGKLEGRK